jgi:hypothetical protein
VSEGNEGAVAEAAAPQPKTFEVWWADPDSAVSTYTGIIGSHPEGEMLYLYMPDDMTLIINLAQVKLVNIWNDV